jgi:hypothetical protein
MENNHSYIKYCRIKTVTAWKSSSIVLTEKHRLKGFENDVLRKILIFGPNREIMTGEYLKLHNEEFLH